MNQSNSVEHLPDLAADATRLARLVLVEDGPLDLTSSVALPTPRAARATVECRGPTVVAGLRYAEVLVLATGCSATWGVSEGTLADNGAIGHIDGDLADILRVERPLLNLLQRACGIASATREYVLAVAGSNCRIRA